MNIFYTGLMEERSTILIRNQTRERLKRTAYKGQTYDDIINHLIELKIKNVSVQNSVDGIIGGLQLRPTTTGHSLARPGQSAGEKSTQGSGSLNG
jgi:hypothetical protein